MDREGRAKGVLCSRFPHSVRGFWLSPEKREGEAERVRQRERERWMCFLTGTLTDGQTNEEREGVRIRDLLCACLCTGLCCLMVYALSCSCI